jgi:flagellar basal-body rod protein FlgB
MYNPNSTMQRCNLMLDLVAQRQRALGMNIANVDTPGYVRKDIDFADYLGSMGSRLETDLSARLGPSGVIEKQEEGVNVAQELAQMQENSILYAMATREMSSIITQMKTVINVGK